MTNVNLVYRRPDGVHAEGTLLTASDGSVAISAVARYDTSDGEMTRVAFIVPLNTQNVFMDPGTWVFELIGVSDGKGGYLSGDDAISVRIVPASGTFDVDDLTETTLSGGSPVPDTLTARVTALEAAFGGVSGGASTLASITNMSADGRTLLTTPNSFSTMRGLLGAAPTASPTFTTALTAANPVFTGSVTIPDNALAIADTSGLQTALDAKAPLASPAFTGNPTAPTPTAGDNDTSIATTAFVETAVAGVIAGGGGAPLNSPAFTGNPTAPTPTVGDNDTSIATTAFVTTAVSATGNNVVIPNVTSLSAPRNHPVTGAALPAAPACCVTWVTVALPTAPTALDLNGDIWWNKETA